MAVPTVRGASCCSIMIIKRFIPQGFSLFFCRQPCLPNDERLFMILLFSSCMYCLTYVVPYISLTPPWTQHIHLMQWINGKDWLSAEGPLGTRHCAKRTLIPTHPHQIRFLALMRSCTVVRSFQVKVNCQYYTPWNKMKHEICWHTMSCVSPSHSFPNFLSFSLSRSYLSFSGAITPERQLPWQQQSEFAPQ